MPEGGVTDFSLSIAVDPHNQHFSAVMHSGEVNFDLWLELVNI
jgi:hypothetical protein